MLQSSYSYLVYSLLERPPSPSPPTGKISALNTEKLSLSKDRLLTSRILIMESQN